MLTDDDWDDIQLIRGYYCLEWSGTDGSCILKLTDTDGNFDVNCIMT